MDVILHVCQTFIYCCHYYTVSYKPGMPVVIFGLLQHEHKMSVLNFLLKRSPEYRPPIKSKDRLIFHVGIRRYSACPIFSQHTNANKHKVGCISI